MKTMEKICKYLKCQLLEVSREVSINIYIEIFSAMH